MDSGDAVADTNVMQGRTLRKRACWTSGILVHEIQIPPRLPATAAEGRLYMTYRGKRYFAVVIDDAVAGTWRGAEVKARNRVH